MGGDPARVDLDAAPSHGDAPGDKIRNLLHPEATMPTLIPTSGSMRIFQNEVGGIGTLIILSAVAGRWSSLSFPEGKELRKSEKPSAANSEDYMVLASVALYRRSNCDADHISSELVDSADAGSATYSPAKRKIDFTLLLDDDGFDLATRMVERGILPSNIELSVTQFDHFDSRTLAWGSKKRDGEDGSGIGCLKDKCVTCSRSISNIQ